MSIKHVDKLVVTIDQAIVHVVPRLDYGGAERLLVDLIPELKSRGYQQTIVALDDQGEMIQQVRVYLDDNCFLHVIKSDLKRPQTLLFALFRLNRLLRGKRPGIVQGWTYIANVVVSLAAIGTGWRTVWGVHAAGFVPSDFRPPARLAFRISQAMARHFPELIIYCAEQSRIDHERFGYPSKKAAVIDNGVNTEKLVNYRGRRAFARSALGLPSEAFTICCVARFAEQKDLPNLFSAVATISQAERPSVLLVGKGMSSSNPAFKTALAASGLNAGTCQMHALDAQEDPYEWMAAADLMVLPSAFGEALPLVVLESLAMGVPVVVTDVGGVSDLIRRLNVGSGASVVPKGSAAYLAREILTMRSKIRLIDEKERAHWAEQIRNHYDLSRVANEYDDHYRKLVGGSMS